MIRSGFHPVAAASGYELYYLWVMAGEGRVMMPYLDPAHAWVHERTLTMDLADALLQLHPGDPVALARRELEPGTELEGAGRRVTVRDTVPHGHKLALTDIAAGEQVRKYGQPIGIATQAIAAGEHVHEHNLRSLSREGLPVPAQGGTRRRAAPRRHARRRPTAADTIPTFDGIVRPDGRVGTRNYVAVLSSVNCSATVVKRIAAAVLGARRARRPSRRRRRHRDHPRQRLRALA